LIFNGNREPITFKLDPQASWRIIAKETTIDPESREYISASEIVVPKISMMLLTEDYFSPSIPFQNHHDDQ
jgi:hypothetical protein